MAHNYLLSDDEFVLIERELIAIMRCDVCGSHPEVYDDEVVCACGRRMPVTENATTAQIIETWNRMVERANRSNSE